MAVAVPFLIQAALSAGSAFALQALRPITDAGGLDRISADLSGEGGYPAWCYGQEAVVDGIPIWIEVDHQSTSHGGQRKHYYKSNTGICWCDTFGEEIDLVDRITAGNRRVYDATPDISITSAPADNAFSVTVENIGSGLKIYMVIRSNDSGKDLSQFRTGRKVQVSGFTGAALNNNGTFGCAKSNKLDNGDSEIWLVNEDAVAYTPGTDTIVLFQELPHFVNNDLRGINHDDITQKPDMPGNNTQVADPLMEAREGSGNVESYRGLAVSVIERLKLKHYGNSIPRLRGIIKTSASAVTLDTVVENMLDRIERSMADIGQPVNIGRDTSGLTGVTVKGATFRPDVSVLEMLQALSIGYGLVMQERAGTLAFFLRKDAPTVTLDPLDFAAHNFNSDFVRPFSTKIRRPQKTPSGVEVKFYSSDNEYEQTSQTVYRDIADESNIQTIELPFTFSDDEGISVAEQQLWMADSGGSQTTFSIPFKYLLTAENDQLNFTDDDGNDRKLIVDEITRKPLDGICTVKATEENPHALEIAATAEEREGDDPEGVFVPPSLFIHPFEHAPIEVIDQDKVVVYMGINSLDRDEPPFEYDLWESRDGTSFRRVVAGLRGQGVIGFTQGTLADVPSTTLLWDDVTTIDVLLESPDVPVTATREEVESFGANRAAIGVPGGIEVIGFTTVTPQADNVYRLGPGMLRGLYNTSHNTGSHVANEPFTMLTPIGDGGSYYRYVMSPSDIAQTIYWKAVPVEEDEADFEAYSMELAGETAMVLPPANIRASRRAVTAPAQGVDITWTRVSRQPGPLFGPKPLLESNERYLIEVFANTSASTPTKGYIRQSPSFFYADAQRSADSVATGVLKLRISQYSYLLQKYGRSTTVTTKVG